MSRLTEMTLGSNKLHFTYDSLGPASVTYNGNRYFYQKNAQGDVTDLVNASGTMPTTLGTANPLRYRGYAYDTETGLYYLSSRYYNPVWGRFVNASTAACLAWASGPSDGSKMNDLYRDSKAGKNHLRTPGTSPTGNRAAQQSISAYKKALVRFSKNEGVSGVGNAISGKLIGYICRSFR